MARTTPQPAQSVLNKGKGRRVGGSKQNKNQNEKRVEGSRAQKAKKAQKHQSKAQEPRERAKAPQKEAQEPQSAQKSRRRLRSPTSRKRLRSPKQPKKAEGGSGAPTCPQQTAERGSGAPTCPLFPTWRSYLKEERGTAKHRKWWTVIPGTLKRIHQVGCHTVSLKRHNR